jgi:hypothetical protein
MNRNQTILIAVAAANLALIVAFLPYDAISITRGGTSFDAFYFFLDRQYNKQVNSNLLYLEVMWILTNTAAGWLSLRDGRLGSFRMSARSGVLAFAAVNLLLLLSLMPFETYTSLQRHSVPAFDGFYFVFGDKASRSIYVPLLLLELFLLAINTAALWLAFKPRKDG